ncbi:MAG: hypothetical protein AXA67_07425 [Methylothermaceae bacteria B42]|nr:MAG: hypothetical protein AXA67_07425 [Methylothermaceae bacteria B42]
MPGVGQVVFFTHATGVAGQAAGDGQNAEKDGNQAIKPVACNPVGWDSPGVKPNLDLVRRQIKEIRRSAVNSNTCG